MATETLRTTSSSPLTIWLIAFICFLVLATTGFFAWSYTEKEAFTDDAQIDGHVHPLNARVGGTITWVNPGIDDTKFVQAGTVLARLDTNDYTPSIDRLKGDVQSERCNCKAPNLPFPSPRQRQAASLLLHELLSAKRWRNSLRHR